MSRLSMPSSSPLFVAAGLCVLAIITAWPEPLGDGWGWATTLAATLGIIASLPFWDAAGAAQRRQGKNPFGGVVAAVLAGGLVGGTLLHLANATMPGSPARDVVVQVTDKFVSRGRRGHKSYHVRTTPVPGEAPSSGHHRVGGLFGNSGSYDDYRIGGCMKLRWRPGWWWPVVARREAVACSGPAAATAAPAPGAVVPMAQPGQAWALVQQRLAEGLARQEFGLVLPPGGLRVNMVVTSDANGMIRQIMWTDGMAAQPEAARRLISRAVLQVPFALAGPAGRYRLWLKLVPGDKAPAGAVEERI
ncbi:hypothetical protein CAP39_12915 [Sphingomonas sp. IBVSS1]|nr:hypothetical protein CAP39_12915 [Sphingomonas sp. IBVSS1]